MRLTEYQQHIALSCLGSFVVSVIISALFAWSTKSIVIVNCILAGCYGWWDLEDPYRYISYLYALASVFGGLVVAVVRFLM